MLRGLDLGPWGPVSLPSVRLLSGSGQNTGPAGLCGWAKGGTGRWLGGWEEGAMKEERHWRVGCSSG